MTRRTPEQMFLKRLSAELQAFRDQFSSDLAAAQALGVPRESFRRWMQGKGQPSAYQAARMSMVGIDITKLF